MEKEIKTHEDLVLGATYEVRGDILKYKGTSLDEEEEYLDFERIRGDYFIEYNGLIPFPIDGQIYNHIKRVYEN